MDVSNAHASNKLHINCIEFSMFFAFIECFTQGVRSGLSSSYLTKGEHLRYAGAIVAANACRGGCEGVQQSALVFLLTGV